MRSENRWWCNNCCIYQREKVVPHVNQWGNGELLWACLRYLWPATIKYLSNMLPGKRRWWTFVQGEIRPDQPRARKEAETFLKCSIPGGLLSHDSWSMTIRKRAAWQMAKKVDFLDSSLCYSPSDKQRQSSRISCFRLCQPSKGGK